MGISVEPFLGSASPQIKQQKHIWDMDKIELTDYTERQGCSQETLAIITDQEITGRTIKTIMDDDMWDEILSTELKISNKITRFKIKSEMQTASTETKQDTRQPTIKAANEKMLVPMLEKPTVGNIHLTTVQWESYAKAIESWLSVGDEFLSAVAASLFTDPDQEIDELMKGKLMTYRHTSTRCGPQAYCSLPTSQWTPACRGINISSMDDQDLVDSRSFLQWGSWSTKRQRTESCYPCESC